MSKNNLPVAPDPFIVALDPNAPALGFDPLADNWNWQDVLPDNYFNIVNLEAKRDTLGGWPIFTPKCVVLKSVPDPEEKDPDLSAKLVLQFHETTMEMVLNKTRCHRAQKLTGTPNPKKWAELLPKLEVYVGVEREMATSEQVLFRPAPGEAPAPAPTNGKASKPVIPVEKINDDLFG